MRDLSNQNPRPGSETQADKSKSDEAPLPPSMTKEWDNEARIYGRDDHGPAIEPSVLFEPETAKKLNWKRAFGS